jgi:2-dehydro-3-deoxyphosphogluconate aldolase/(4S)-4-hydroxy-2-oxoglutarate aldolase
MPSGGVTVDSAAGFIQAGAAVLSVGGGLIDPNLIKEKDYTKLTRRTRSFLQIISETRAGMAAPQTN